MLLTLCAYGENNNITPISKVSLPDLNESGILELKRFRLSKSDFDKPISNLKLYFHLEAKHFNELPLLDLIVTKDRPCSEIRPAPSKLVSTGKSETSARLVNSGQVLPDSCFWQIRDESGKVIRQWEPNFYNWLRADGDLHYGTKVSLPRKDFEDSYLLLTFTSLESAQDQEFLVFEISLKELSWDNEK
jgi:hypothetical protein